MEGNIVEVSINKKALRAEETKENYIYIMQDFNNIKRGDTIVNPENQEESYVIDEIVNAKGVFKANSGIATFTSIYTENMIDGKNGYIILSPEEKGGSVGIKAYDIIVSDAKNNYINEGDKIN